MEDQHTDNCPGEENPEHAKYIAKRSGGRRFLKLVGKGATVVAVGALGLTTWRAVSQRVFSTNTGTAYEAWVR